MRDPSSALTLPTTLISVNLTHLSLLSLSPSSLESSSPLGSPHQAKSFTQQQVTPFIPFLTLTILLRFFFGHCMISENCQQ